VSVRSSVYLWGNDSWQQSLPVDGAKSDQHRSLEDSHKHWSDRNHALPNLVGEGGNAPPLTDPTNGLTFPNLNPPPFGGQTFQTNLIMPEPCPFLSRKLPKCSIIRPTETKGAAMGAVKFLTAMGLFIGQSNEFFQLLMDLAEDADEARREC
jgi:hypothetical protein